jgi:hypothetical protein
MFFFSAFGRGACLAHICHFDSRCLFDVGGVIGYPRHLSIFFLVHSSYIMALGVLSSRYEELHDSYDGGDETEE